MSTTRHLPISTVELHQLIRHALSDLRHARSVDNAASIDRAERRMNAIAGPASQADVRNKQARNCTQSGFLAT